MRKEPIVGLDILRFCAASMVLLYHLGFKAFAAPLDPLNAQMAAPPPPGPAVTWWGWIGVQIFFVISGLVIANSSQGATWRSFVVRRIARLFPAMLICATLAAPVVILFEGLPLPQVAVLWLKSIVFFPLGPWLSGQFWTLAVEIAFYGVVWLMILGRAARHLDGLAWGLALISAAYWFGLLAFHGSDNFVRLTQLLLFQHGCYFAIGITLSTIDSDRFTPMRGLLLVVCAATAWLQISHVQAAAPPENGIYHAAHAGLPFAIWLAATAALAASLAWRNKLATAVGRHGGVVRAIGVATYPLYLIHLQAGGPVLIYALRAGLPAWLATLLAFAVSLLAAAIVAIWLEPPLHRAVMRLLKRILPEPRQGTA